MSITKQVVFIAKDENVVALKGLLTDMVEASRAEEGCLLYNIYQLKNKPTHFLVVEAWADENSLKGHQHSAHYIYYKANFEAHTADKYSEELVSLG